MPGCCSGRAVVITLQRYKEPRISSFNGYSPRFGAYVKQRTMGNSLLPTLGEDEVINGSDAVSTRIHGLSRNDSNLAFRLITLKPRNKT